MYISKLSLYGFKSFLKKSEIHFGSGITSVVGPNGCGKTNIVDAIRWVIGEQKSSILRTDRITDVIFNGTSTRRPLNLAEVSLIIHNISGRIPIEYTDIMITRRIYRNGESEYFINKNLCRLKDITDLFIDTGMGANAYSIIELKMIENILSENLEERKRLFEEAAGVNKYRVQRKAAIRKLDATRDDLVRLNDIIIEVESKVKSLRKQLRRYEKYQEVTQKLVDAEVVLASRRVLNIKNNLDPIASDIKEKESRFQKIVNELEKKENSWKSRQKLFEEKEKFFQEKNIELDKLKSERNKFQTEDLLLKERYRNISQTISRLEKDINSLGENISYSEDREIELQNEYNDIESKLAEKQVEFQEISTEHQKIESLFKNIDEEIQSLQDERYSFFRKQAEYSARYNSLRENISQREKELKSIKEQIEKQTSAEKSISQTITDITEKIKIFKEELEKYKEAGKKEKNRNLNLINEERNLTDTLRGIESEQDKLFNLIQFYSGIIQSKEGYSPGLQYVLDNLQDFPGIKGALSDLISVDSKYYLSLESVIKDISRLLVADNRSSAVSSLNKLESLGKGKVSIIPLDVILQIDKTENVFNDEIQPLEKYIKCDKYLENLKEFLFHDIYICEDAKFNDLINDQKLNGIGIVSNKGKYKDSNGFFTGGSEFSESNVLIGRSEKLIELKEKYKSVSNRQNKLKSELDKIRGAIEIFISAQKELENNANSIEEKIRFQVDNLRENEQKLIQCESIQEALNENKIALKVALENFNEKLQKDIPEKSILGDKISKFDTDIEGKRGKSDKIKGYLNEISQRLQNERIELINLENRFKNIIDNQGAIKRSIDDLNKKRDYSIQERDKNELLKSDIASKIELNKVEVEKVNNKVLIVEGEVDELKSSYQNIRSEIQLINEDLFNLRHEKEQLSEKLKILELESSKYSASESEIRSVLLEKYNRTISDELSGELPLEEEAQRIVNRYKKKLEMIGMVNMAVKDEYEEEASRLSFLVEQRDDLVESEKGLKEVIVQIDNIAREQFLEVFEKIRHNFQSTFEIFFGGGEADVKLVGDSDPLESQIEIWACPGGKKMRSLKMLSAGEKALTAIALLFGIYQVKPSPFCILDEVDAPLDDENVKRFINVIKTFAQKTQFIIITHNKLTMSIADILYGVTMAEKGVSQIVSVKLE